MSVWFSMILFFLMIILPVEVPAYIGPGAGLSAVGSLLALMAAVFLGIVGFVWYPVKRILRRRKARQTGEENKAGRENKEDQ